MNDALFESLMADITKEILKGSTTTTTEKPYTVSYEDVKELITTSESRYATLKISGDLINLETYVNLRTARFIGQTLSFSDPDFEFWPDGSIYDPNERELMIRTNDELIDVSLKF